MKDKKSWIATATMGYGHNRTAFNLKHIALNNIVVKVDNYINIPKFDKLFWTINQKSYNLFSHLIDIPLFGEKLFSFFDKFQRIENFYKNKHIQKVPLQLKNNYFFIKFGWGKNIILKLKNINPQIPFITTFFSIAYMAEEHKYPGEIFCVICDTDISRSWAPLNPKSSKIKYFVPTKRVKIRLENYGVKKENIFLTGYPLPLENLGDRKLTLLKKTILKRLEKLDPKNKTSILYKPIIEKYIGKFQNNKNKPLTLMFSVGGAGVQTKLAVNIIESLRDEIKRNNLNLILVAGTNKKIKDYFLNLIKFYNLENIKNLEILYFDTLEKFFSEFNKKLTSVDLILTKPSELSFYAALGIPILILPPVGAHEVLNKNWLIRKGAGIEVENLKYIKNWLSDFLKEGIFFRASLFGFLNIRKLGTFKIEDIIQKI